MAVYNNNKEIVEVPDLDSWRVIEYFHSMTICGDLYGEDTDNRQDIKDYLHSLDIVNKLEIISYFVCLPREIIYFFYNVKHVS